MFEGVLMVGIPGARGRVGVRFLVSISSSLMVQMPDHVNRLRHGIRLRCCSDRSVVVDVLHVENGVLKSLRLLKLCSEESWGSKSGRGFHRKECQVARINYGMAKNELKRVVAFS